MMGRFVFVGLAQTAMQCCVAQILMNSLVAAAAMAAAGIFLWISHVCVTRDLKVECDVELGNFYAVGAKSALNARYIQGSAKRCSLGCVNPVFWLPLATGGPVHAT